MISALPFIEETLTSARTPQSTRTIQLAQMKKVQMDQDQSNLILNAPDFVLSLSLSSLVHRSFRIPPHTRYQSQSTPSRLST